MHLSSEKIREIASSVVCGVAELNLHFGVFPACAYAGLKFDAGSAQRPTRAARPNEA